MGSAETANGVRDVFFDESGFTGRALLDPTQPHFTIASSIITDLEAEEILRRAFPRYQADEFKFQKVWQRYRNQIPAFCEAVGALKNRVYIWQIDKRFSVLVKMIDFLMEPIAHEAGFDFYKNAYGYKLANYIHFGLRHVAEPPLYDPVIEAYFAFANDPTPASLEVLRFRLTILANSATPELRFFFSSCLMGVDLFHHFNNIETFRDTLEVYVTSMLNAVGYWSAEVPERLNLRHDQSSAFFAQRELWQAMISPRVPDQLHPVANGPAIRFPLPVEASVPTDSRTSYGIQLCDLLAGFATKCAALRETEEGRAFFEPILSGSFGGVPINGVGPALDFPDSQPERLDGPDPVDQMLDIIRAGGGLP